MTVALNSDQHKPLSLIKQPNVLTETLSDKQREDLRSFVTEVTTTVGNTDCEHCFASDRDRDRDCNEQTTDVDVILGAVVARPWRRTTLDAATMADLRAKVCAALANRRPLEFSLPFGGYKSWRQPSFPHLDWAEVFWLDYLRQYGERIVRLHEPGVVISLTCMRGVLGWVNNLRQADQDSYLDELGSLLHRQSTARLSFKLVDLSEHYGDTQSLLELLRERELIQQKPSDAELRSAARNLIRQGGIQDLSQLDPGQWQAAVEASARRCAAMMSLEKRRDFNKYGPRIQLTHVRGASLALHIGSCQTAVAQPWVCSGYVQWRADRGKWLARMATSPINSKHAGVVPVSHQLSDVSSCLKTLPIVLGENNP